jgi:hypothetical protein
MMLSDHFPESTVMKTATIADSRHLSRRLDGSVSAHMSKAMTTGSTMSGAAVTGSGHCHSACQGLAEARP